MHIFVVPNTKQTVMKRLLLSMAALVVILTACNQTKQENATEDQAAVAEEVVFVTLSEFDDKAADFVDKQIKLSGTIDHVCKHGGQKMFIVDKDSDTRLKIVTGENMAAFNTDLEGETVMVVGVVDELRIDEEYLREWEEEIKDGTEIENEAMHSGEQKGDDHAGDHEQDGEYSNAMKNINDFRQQLKESNKEYLSFYSIICIDYEVVTEQEETASM